LNDWNRTGWQRVSDFTTHTHTIRLEGQPMDASKFICRAAGYLAVCLLLTACEKKFNPADGVVPAAPVDESTNTSIVTVEKPEQFSVVDANKMQTPALLNVTGSVNPDIAREVPAISLASGRIVAIRARLDDNVRKGQLLLQVQSTDATNAFDAYLKAVNDEQLANKAYIRAKDLYEHGAIPQAQLEQAEDTEKDAKADLVAAEEQLQTLGVDKNHPSPIVNVYSPITGVIVAQNVTNAAAAGVTYAGTSTLFTVADLSVVWILCDVYENDISRIHLGQEALIRVNAYPDRLLKGHITDIGPVLDPNIRTAKIRVEIANPGILRLGMFVTATFESRDKRAFAIVPASAILHLHDRDWVFVPAGGKQFKRVEVEAGDMLPGKNQQILSGITPGQQVVSNVLALEATLETQ
jgi:membrane fusion protein, heavy metal efflux system